MAKTHGMSNTKTYDTWAAMIQRCYDPKHIAYRFYGAKGIAVCDRWRENFANFYADMGVRPTPGHSIDRIDGTKGYSKENCRWATMAEQIRNMRSTKKLDYNGESLTISEWAARSGLPRGVLVGRIYRGWPFEVAINTPQGVPRILIRKRHAQISALRVLCGEG